VCCLQLVVCTCDNVVRMNRSNVGVVGVNDAASDLLLRSRDFALPSYASAARALGAFVPTDLKTVTARTYCYYSQSACR